VRQPPAATVFTLKTFTTIGPITGLTFLTIPPT
jgi:hypothetical protein